MMRNKTLWICCGLSVLTLLVFGRIATHEFVNYDVLDYILKNPRVNQGLSFSNVLWAFTAFETGDWQPLTWISWMFDCQLFGLHAGWHHVMNLFYHMANVLILFLLLKKMTGAQWRSAAVAALFAIHPLHVESVAWVAERKDTLSTLFWLLTTWFYVERKYYRTFLFFALGLMSKPMLVTLPLTLMMLDYWPLKRKITLVDKIPLFLLSAMSSGFALWANTKAGGMVSMATYSLGVRLSNVLVSYIGYLEKTFWPVNLAVFYPHPGQVHPLPVLIFCALLFLGITFFAIKWREKYPYLIVGWLWYVVILLPVIGILQAGAQAMADRYTYVPHIGLFLGLVWAACPSISGTPSKSAGFGSREKPSIKSVNPALLEGVPIVPVVFTACLIIVLSVVAWKQVGVWKNAETLNQHALAVTKDNFMAHANLGYVHELREDFSRAEKHYQTSLQLNPGNVNVMNNLGNTYLQQEKWQDAQNQYEAVLLLRSDHFDALVNLGLALREKRAFDAARLYFKRALEQRPDHVKSYVALADMAMQVGDREQAKVFVTQALKLQPDHAMANHIANYLQK